MAKKVIDDNINDVVVAINSYIHTRTYIISTTVTIATAIAVVLWHRMGGCHASRPDDCCCHNARKAEYQSADDRFFSCKRLGFSNVHRLPLR